VVDQVISKWWYSFSGYDNNVTRCVLPDHLFCSSLSVYESERENACTCFSGIFRERQSLSRASQSNYLSHRLVVTCYKLSRHTIDLEEIQTQRELKIPEFRMVTALMWKQLCNPTAVYVTDFCRRGGGHTPQIVIGSHHDARIWPAAIL
jgi:hypothetical protein